MNGATELQGGVVMFADDDAMFRESHASLLRRDGYTCVCAPDAVTSKKLLQEMEIHTLIADIRMPGNSDLELVKSIAQLAPGLPVILLTGYPAVDTAARSVRLAVTAYLTKPPDLDELRSLVRQSVSSYRRLRAVRASREHLQIWAEELGPIEEILGGRPGAIPNHATQDYLRVTLRNTMAQLADLDRSVAAWSGCKPSQADSRQLDLVSAVRRTIEVLEKSRRNFKSKELGDLRKQLQALVPRDKPGNDPKTDQTPGEAQLGLLSISPAEPERAMP